VIGCEGGEWIRVRELTCNHLPKHTVLGKTGHDETRRAKEIDVGIKRNARCFGVTAVEGASKLEKRLYVTDKTDVGIGKHHIARLRNSVAAVA
jgi:hypothetical protein